VWSNVPVVIIFSVFLLQLMLLYSGDTLSLSVVCLCYVVFVLLFMHSCTFFFGVLYIVEIQRIGKSALSGSVHILRVGRRT